MKLSVGRVVLICVVAMQALTVAVLGSWVYFATRQDIAALSEQTAEAAVARMVEFAEDFLRPAQGAAELVRGLIASDVLAAGETAALERLFLGQLRSYPQLASLYVGGSDGSFTFVSRVDDRAKGAFMTKLIAGTPETAGAALTWRGADLAVLRRNTDPADVFDPRDRPWYRDAAGARDTVWTKPYVFFTSGRPGITAAVAVPAEEGGSTSVVGIDIDLGALSGLLARIATGLGGPAFIADQGGNVIAHADPALAVRRGPDDKLRFVQLAELPSPAGTLAPRFLAQLGDTALDVSLTWFDDTADQRVAFAPLHLAGQPWLLGLTISETAAERRAHGSLYGLLVAGGLCLIVTVIAAAGLGYSISRPLAGLARNAARLRAGAAMLDPVDQRYKEIAAIATTLEAIAEDGGTSPLPRARTSPPPAAPDGQQRLG